MRQQSPSALQTTAAETLAVKRPGQDRPELRLPNISYAILLFGLSAPTRSNVGRRNEVQSVGRSATKNLSWSDRAASAVCEALLWRLSQHLASGLIACLDLVTPEFLISQIAFRFPNSAQASPARSPIALRSSESCWGKGGRSASVHFVAILSGRAGSVKSQTQCRNADPTSHDDGRDSHSRRRSRDSRSHSADGGNRTSRLAASDDDGNAVSLQPACSLPH